MICLMVVRAGCWAIVRLMAVRKGRWVEAMKTAALMIRPARNDVLNRTARPDPARLVDGDGQDREADVGGRHGRNGVALRSHPVADGGLRAGFGSVSAGEREIRVLLGLQNGRWGIKTDVWAGSGHKDDLQVGRRVSEG